MKRLKLKVQPAAEVAEPAEAAEAAEPVVSAGVLQERISSLCDAARALLHQVRREELEFELLGDSESPEELVALANSCYALAQRLYEYGVSRGLKVQFSYVSLFGVSMLHNLLKKNAPLLRPVNPIFRLPDLDAGELKVAQEEERLQSQLQTVLQRVRKLAKGMGHELDDAP